VPILIGCTLGHGSQKCPPEPAICEGLFTERTGRSLIAVRTTGLAEQFEFDLGQVLEYSSRLDGTYQTRPINHSRLRQDHHSASMSGSTIPWSPNLISLMALNSGASG
jgi:hypothetical protein